jgi:enamine deaminase RidA (YjgF/YER057c/UK114 family)
MLVLLATLALAVEIQPILPANGAKPVGPYTPGLLAGDYLYVSGQGAGGATGIDAQTRACLNNVKAIVEGAGLTMANVVYAQLYLADIKNYEAVNQIWPEYFPDLPARATLEVTRMPTDTPIEVTVVAYKGKREAVTPPNTASIVPITPGVMTADRFFIAGILGRDNENNVIPKTVEAQVDTLVERFQRVLTAAQLTPAHVAFLNVYRTPAMPLALVTRALSKLYRADRPAVAIVEVPALPFGANVSLTGVAGRDLASVRREGVCSTIGETRYCSLSSGSTEVTGRQTRSTLRRLDLDRIVATNVYLDSIDEFAEMNAAYAEAFSGKVLPTRTTVQPMKTGRNGRKFRFSFVALR